MTRLAAYARSFACFSRDARVFLLTALILGAATSVYWIDFNLYLQAIGIAPETIGQLMAVSQVAGVLAAFPAIALSHRIGRRAVIATGIVLVIGAFGGYLNGSTLLLFVSVAVYGAGSQIIQVVQIPYMADRTEPEHRNEFFSALFAIGFATNAVAATAGGYIATTLSGRLGLSAATGPFQILLVAMIALAALALLTVFMLADDRPHASTHAETPGRFGLHVVDRRLFFRLLLPGFLTSLGAGQLIPYLNLFVKGKFGLDLAAVNNVFAITSLGTVAAMMIQPALARRFGKIHSIVIVQSASIPFLLVLGFSPVLLTVVGAMAIRNSLMNAGSPIFDSFAMERITPAERGTLSAGMTVLWAAGWAIAGPFYGFLQSAVGFTTGYSIDFLLCIGLYTLSTFLLWYWFHDYDRVGSRVGDAATERLGAEAVAGGHGSHAISEV